MERDQGDDAKRDQWLYSYTGRELLPYAQKLMDHYRKLESESKEKISLLKTGLDIKIEQIRFKSYCLTCEKLSVWIHEFWRSPTRDFHLSLNDVVFFGIANDSLAWKTRDEY